MKKFAISMVVAAVLSTAALAGDKKGGNSSGGSSNGMSNHSNSTGSHHDGTHNNHNGDGKYKTGDTQKYKMESLSPKMTSKDYHLQYGKKYSFGYCYFGYNHNHWTHRCWYDSYGCYCYWCPCTLVWYWWCAKDDCYYPISYRPY